jgi:hypothetical protein
MWSRFVDVVVGFKTRGYKPDPPWELTEQMPDYEMSQTVFLGLALNAQGVFDYLLPDRTPRVASVLVNGVFEFFSIPYTTLPVLQGSRAPTLPIGEGNGIGR